MQGDKTAVSAVMEAAANVAASAKSGLDKTKAVVEEKLEKMSTNDEVEKDMAKLRREEKIDLAELRKVKAYAQNAVAAAARSTATTPKFTDGGHFTTIGSFDQPAALTSTNTWDQAEAGGNFVVGSGNGAESTGNISSSTTQAMDSKGISMTSGQPASGATGLESTTPK